VTPAYRSKTVATWLALLGGSFGAHRVYLHGWRDVWAWLHPWPTLLGLAGIQRVQDDHLAWLLIPLLGLMLSPGHAVRHRLRPDAGRAMGRAPQPRPRLAGTRPGDRCWA
jgi:hypothetical protein